MRLRTKIRLCKIGANLLRVAAVTDLIVMLYKLYHFIFVGAIHLADPKQDLFRAVVISAMALIIIPLCSWADELEFKSYVLYDTLYEEVVTSGLFPRDTRRGAANE